MKAHPKITILILQSSFFLTKFPFQLLIQQFLTKNLPEVKVGFRCHGRHKQQCCSSILSSGKISPGPSHQHGYSCLCLSLALCLTVPVILPWLGIL